MTRERVHQLLREILLVAVLCLFYTLFRTLTAQGFLYYVRNAPMPFMRIFPGELLTHCLWGIFFFVIRGLVHAFRDHIPRPGARLAAHALMYLLTPLLLRTLSLWLYDVLDLWKSIPGNIQGARLLGVAYSRWLFYDYILYAVILGLILFFDAYKREKQYQIARLQTELRQVTFRNLSEELRPQFVLSLFDKLAKQIEKDPDKAGRMVSRFCAWLRSLQNMATSLLVPLQDELQFFNVYLDIERLCHGQRLNADIRLPAEALAWPVPPLLLQPLVEAPLNRLACDGKTTATVNVKGLIDGSILKIGMDIDIPAVPGDGADLDRDWSQPIKAKLAALYGEDSALNVRQGNNGALLIELRLPFRELQGLEQTGGSECAS